MTVSSQGALAKFCLDTVAPIDGSSIPFDFLSNTLAAENTLIGTEGIRGTRSRSKERVRLANVNVGGTVTMNPSAAELDWLLINALGFSESTNVFTPTETVPSFVACLDRIAKVHTYLGCYVNRATFSGSSGQPITLALDIIGTSESEGAAASFPALTFDLDVPYIFSDSATGLTLEGTGSRKFDNFELVIDNVLNARFMNSRTASDISATDRSVTLSMSTPYTADESALYTTPVGSAAGAAGALVFTNGSKVLTFTFANLKMNPARTPPVNGRGEILLPLQMTAYKSGSTAELIITHVP